MAEYVNIDQIDKSAYDWSWDDKDGVRFKRFRRDLPIEAWLLGFERLADGEEWVGNEIVSPDGSRRPVRVAHVCFGIDIANAESGLAADLLDRAAATFPAYPPDELIAMLDRLGPDVPPLELTG